MLLNVSIHLLCEGQMEKVLFFFQERFFKNFSIIQLKGRILVIS